MNIENELGKKVREIRKQKGYTQEQLAELIGIDNKHLSKIENGVHLPNYKTLKKLSEVLHFNLRETKPMLSKTSPICSNPVFNRALRILTSAKNENELINYYDALKLASRLMNYQQEEDKTQ